MIIHLFEAPIKTHGVLAHLQSGYGHAAGVGRLGGGKEDLGTLEATKYLQDNGILFGPAKAANAGGVAVSGLEMSQNSMRMPWSFEEVDEHLKKIMVNIYHNIDQAAKDYGAPGNLVMGANIAGFEKVCQAMIWQGVSF